MIRKEFAGSVFEIPPELEEEFNTLSDKISTEVSQTKVALLWVKFYLKFDPYYKGEIPTLQ